MPLQDRTLNSLFDVLASEPSNNQVLGYDSITEKRINKSITIFDDFK